VTHGDTVARMPDALSFTDAAAIPEAFITAWDAMVSQGGLGAGETVLIHAVGSGVGTAAVQLARALSARPLGTARTAAKLGRAGKLGMDRGFAVEQGKFADDVLRATGGRGVDVVLELVGGAYVAEDFLCTATRGRIVVVGLMAGVRAELNLGVMLQKRLVVRGTVLRGRPLGEKIAATRQFERHVVPLVEAGTLVPVVERVMPLSEAAAAHAAMASNEGFGKIVLAVN
ncbi:MAG TPA: zinc-binding dehydrogenase, partial [Polyangia bacterium]